MDYCGGTNLNSFLVGCWTCSSPNYVRFSGSSLGAHYGNCSQLDFDSWLPPSGLRSETMCSTLQSVSIADAGLSFCHSWLQDMWYALVCPQAFLKSTVIWQVPRLCIVYPCCFAFSLNISQGQLANSYIFILHVMDCCRPFLCLLRV